MGVSILERGTKMSAISTSKPATGSSVSEFIGPSPDSISILQEDHGFIFVAEGDMAVYSYSKDSENKSACYDACSNTWPPVLAREKGKVVGDWIVIERDDGKLQWSYKGKPAYTYDKDTPGTSRGDGIGGVWRILKP